MKTGTIPFPREFGPGASGIDVLAVKRALAVALKGPNGMSLKAETFGKAAQDALRTFKKKRGLLDDPIYTLQAHQKLVPFFDERGAALMVKEALHLTALQQRHDFTSALHWMVEHRALFTYAEVRPIPEWLPPFGDHAIETDCSGAIELGARWAKVPDPSRLGFSGAGNTGSLLAACQQISSVKAEPGDLIVYRAGTSDHYGHHAVAILGVRPGHTDFDIFSNGHRGDPGIYRHSNMLANQRTYGAGLATFLRFLPIP